MTLAKPMETVPEEIYLFRERPEGAFRYYDLDTLDWSLPGDILRLDFSGINPFQIPILREKVEEQGFKARLYEDTAVMVLDIVMTLPAYAFEALSANALRFN